MTQFSLWDAKLLPFAASNHSLFVCPADKLAPKWTNNVRLPQRNPSYGYNIAGSGRYPAAGASLGLDGGFDYECGSTFAAGVRSVSSGSIRTRFSRLRLPRWMAEQYR